MCRKLETFPVARPACAQGQGTVEQCGERMGNADEDLVIIIIMRAAVDYAIQRFCLYKDFAYTKNLYKDLAYTKIPSY